LEQMPAPGGALTGRAAAQATLAAKMRMAEYRIWIKQTEVVEKGDKIRRDDIDDITFLAAWRAGARARAEEGMCVAMQGPTPLPQRLQLLELMSGIFCTMTAALMPEMCGRRAGSRQATTALTRLMITDYRLRMIAMMITFGALGVTWEQVKWFSVEAPPKNRNASEHPLWVESGGGESVWWVSSWCSPPLALLCPWFLTRRLLLLLLLLLPTRSSRYDGGADSSHAVHILQRSFIARAFHL
jgi:hypothetical protein